MRLKENLAIREVAGQWVLMPSVIDPNSETVTVCLSGSAKWLIEQLQGRDFTSEDAVSLLTGRYQIDAAIAAADASSLLSTLESEGFICL